MILKIILAMVELLINLEYFRKYMRLTGPGGLLGYISDFSLSSYFSNFLDFRHPRSLNQSKSLKSRLFPLLRGLKK